MKIWLIKDGENLPIEPGARKMRAWLLAEELIRRGHAVTWWTSTFSHARKTLLFPDDREIEASPGLKLRLLHAGSYQRNFSLGRYTHHWRLGRSFRNAAQTVEAPDLVISAFPIIDLAYEAVRYAKRRKIPVIVDVRDLWPDTFLDFCPSWLRPIARILLWKDFQRTKSLLRQADGLAAISRGCLAWGCRRGERETGGDTRVFCMGYPESPGGAQAKREEPGQWAGRLKGKIVFTYVGSFGRSYDLDTLASAARLLHARGRTEIHFVLAGAGERLESLRAACGDLPNVTLPGWLEHRQILDVLRASHAGIIPGPAVCDAMPNKVFEYLSEGLPLLSCVTGELQKMIEENAIGRSYSSGDPEALASQIEEMAENRGLLETMAKNARSLFAQEFRAGEIYARYADFAEQTAAASRTVAAM